MTSPPLRATAYTLVGFHEKEAEESFFMCQTHRRRIETEGKAKVVASVWGAEFVQFLAALVVLPWSTWKKRLNSARLFGKNG